MLNRSVVFVASSVLIISNVSSFAPQGHSSRLRHTALRSSPPDTEDQETETEYFNVLTEDGGPAQDEVGWAPNTPAVTASVPADPINGWVPREEFACWGLPGALAPTGYFDPLGFAQRGTTLNDVKRLREAEVQHGRVAMLATVGYLAGEAISGPFGITGPANDQLQQVPAPAFALLTIAIGAAELYRAKVGWVEPTFRIGSKTLWTLRDTYYPGDIGFDPLGLKPTDPYEFQVMQTKELQNGRLAMLGWAGMCAQELVNHKSILGTFDFYQKVYSGVNPYEY